MLYEMKQDARRASYEIRGAWLWLATLVQIIRIAIRTDPVLAELRELRADLVSRRDPVPVTPVTPVTEPTGTPWPPGLSGQKLVLWYEGQHPTAAAMTTHDLADVLGVSAMTVSRARRSKEVA